MHPLHRAIAHRPIAKNGPAELIVAIATYMLILDRVRLATTCKAFNFAVYGAPSLWRTFSRRLERLTETSFRVHEPFGPCAGRLTDAALHALLLRCRAAGLTTELSLFGCVQVTGSGLIPLAGETARTGLQSVSQSVYLARVCPSCCKKRPSLVCDFTSSQLWPMVLAQDH
jgi:hypothetical protein